MIEVRNLSHSYGRVPAVRDLSFRVEKGQVLGLLGPNGAGKTTTMRAVVGLLTPTEGRVLIGGHDLVTESGAKLRSAVDRAIEICDLGDMRRRLIGFCSRGYRQRTGLAQALVADPPVLILDEPTVGLDPRQVVAIRDQIEEIAKDKAVILSTHILSEASRLCDRVLILDRGICRAEDSPEALARALSERPRLRVVARPFADGRSCLAAMEGLSIVSESAQQSGLEIELGAGLDAAAVVRTLVESGCAVDEIRPERMGLEEVFLELLKQEEDK